ncbi:hypothetical protein ACFOG5_12675 [Pedobacter fastidiosus]|uniref:hypothetical protein n=1 Tax=Pedobacter fastidiosus TaxID=2765361 RepID=UPI003613CB71
MKCTKNAVSSICQMLVFLVYKPDRSEMPSIFHWGRSVSGTEYRQKFSTAHFQILYLKLILNFAYL